MRCQYLSVENMHSKFAGGNKATRVTYQTESNGTSHLISREEIRALEECY